MEAQLKRGLLEICVLATLRNSESYGYKIIKDVSNVIPISESTLYPSKYAWKQTIVLPHIRWNIIVD